MFWVGLAVGIGIVVLALVILLLLRGITHSRSEAEASYRKVLVVSVRSPFTERALDVAIRMAGSKGIVETLYIIEIGMERPLDVVADDEVAAGLQALEDASYAGRSRGKRLLPRLEKARMGSKTILDIQGEEGFDLLILDLDRRSVMADTTRKIVQYIQEKASCTVIVLSGKETLKTGVGRAR